jgi:hypothetical protein
MSNPYVHLPIPTPRTLIGWMGRISRGIGFTIFAIIASPTLLIGILLNGLGLFDVSKQPNISNMLLQKVVVPLVLILVVLFNFGAFYLGTLYVASTPSYEVVDVEVDGDMIFMKIEQRPSIIQGYLGQWLDMNWTHDSQHYVYSVEDDVWLRVKQYSSASPSIGSPVFDPSFNINVRVWTHESLNAWLNEWRRNDRRNKDTSQKKLSIKMAQEAARLVVASVDE